MQSLGDIKASLLKRWQKFHFHRDWLEAELHFPLHIKLKRPTDKVVLHEFARVQSWQQKLAQDCDKLTGVNLTKQLIQFSTMGKQNLPANIEIDSIEALSRILGKWGEWQQFEADIALVDCHFPALKPWQIANVGLLIKYAGQWQQLLAIARWFVANPRPGCYIRELPISGVDSKFIESRKHIVKSLLDAVLPSDAIDPQYEKLSDNGFEQRFGLKYPQPGIRFRLLDSMFFADFGGASDISLPLDEFAQLDLLVDTVFITENLINGLAFPAQNNSIVIFGKGYGIQTLKHIAWLKQCNIVYWGDIDTDGFAILSQVRGYFPKTRSLLMDKDTLQACKGFWGEESATKKQTPDTLEHLTPVESELYRQLKTHHFADRLRLEQERIPFALLQEALKGRVTGGGVMREQMSED